MLLKALEEHRAFCRIKEGKLSATVCQCEGRPSPSLLCLASHNGHRRTRDLANQVSRKSTGRRVSLRQKRASISKNSHALSCPVQ